VKQILCIKLVKYWDKYTEMHGQQNVKIYYMYKGKSVPLQARSAQRVPGS